MDAAMSTNDVHTIIRYTHDTRHTIRSYKRCVVAPSCSKRTRVMIVDATKRFSSGNNVVSAEESNARMVFVCVCVCVRSPRASTMHAHVLVRPTNRNRIQRESEEGTDMKMKTTPSWISCGMKKGKTIFG